MNIWTDSIIKPFIFKMASLYAFILLFVHSSVCVFVHVCVVETKAHLDHSEQALVSGGVSGDGKASSGISSDDAVHSAPG